MGWDHTRQSDFTPQEHEGWKPGRILSPGRGIFKLAVQVNGDEDEWEECQARLSGKALGRGEVPVAGDWVAWRESGNQRVIGSLLQRKTAVSRKAAGTGEKQQIIGANIDVLFLVQALGPGRGFTLRGLERYLTMAWESGCQPVVVLNKSDLSENPEADKNEASSVAPGVEVILCSASTGEGISTLSRWLENGVTGAFVGPSGAGKSSLVNAIAQIDLAEAGAVRQGDYRGRHTTTNREIHVLPSGALLMDTPGMRELQPWGDEQDANSAFPEIEEAAENCRFRDCTHDGEPGCGVRQALEEGQIQSERFDAWLELRREMAWSEGRRQARNRKERDATLIQIAKYQKNLKSKKEVW